MTVPIENDAAYWRKMYEERLALQEDGFTALLAERDALRLAAVAVLEYFETPVNPHNRLDASRSTTRMEHALKLTREALDRS